MLPDDASRDLWYIYFMKKRALVSTNPYLKNSLLRKEALVRTVESSSAIEGIRSSLRSGERAVKKRTSGDITVRTSKSLRLRKRISSS
jgi:Fic family protein